MNLLTREKTYKYNTGPARRPAWLARGKWPSRASFVGDGGSFRGCPVCAHLPPHFLEYTYVVCTPSTVTSKITHSRQGPAPHATNYRMSLSILCAKLSLIPSIPYMEKVNLMPRILRVKTLSFNASLILVKCHQRILNRRVSIHGYNVSDIPSNHLISSRRIISSRQQTIFVRLWYDFSCRYKVCVRTN